MLERKLGAKKTNTAFPVRTLLRRTELQQKQPMISILKTSSKCPGGRREKRKENVQQKVKKAKARKKKATTQPSERSLPTHSRKRKATEVLSTEKGRH